MIHHCPYYGMQCDAEMIQQLINKATTTLKTEYILRTNKLALMTNVLIYVSTSSRKVSFPNKCFSYTISKVFLYFMYLIYYIFKEGLICYSSKLIIIGLQKLQRTPNNTSNLL